MPSKTFSYGGGVQSTAALVLAARKEIPYDTFVFANVGDDSENPTTIRYLHEIAIPFAAKHGVVLEVVQLHVKGKPVTILERIHSTNKGGVGRINIPVYMSSGMPAQRRCTYDFKVEVIQRRYGVVGLGISVDEIHRARFGEPDRVYPLLELGLFRRDCIRIIEDAGLPVPPKSSCWFCPFHSMQAWQEMRNNQPEQFQKAVALEQFINERRVREGYNKVWFSRTLRPLDEATTDLHQMSFDDDFCDSGYCFL